MAKKIIPVDDQQDNVSLITLAFPDVPVFVLPDKDASLKIIQYKKDEYAKLTIKGLEDKDGYRAVNAAMLEMKNTRLALTKAAKQNVIDKVSSALKDFKADLALLEDGLSAIEADLRIKKDAIDDEKERLKKEAALLKQQAIEKRISDLFVLGAILDNNIYSFPYDAGLIINSVQLAEFEDAEFGELLEDVKTAWTVEQDRIKAEQEEALRLQQEQDEQAALQLEQAKQINAQAATLNEKQRNLRIKELKLLGAVQQDDDTYLFPDKPEFHLAPLSGLMDMDDAAWDELMYDIENFVPATDPLVKDTPDDATIQHLSSEPVHVNIPEQSLPELQLNDEPYVSPVSSIVADKEVGTVMKELIFTEDEPYTDFDISSKIYMRVYPDEFEKEAINGQSLANEGRLQGVNWCLIKK